MPTIPDNSEVWRVEQGYVVDGSGSPAGRVRRTVLCDGSERFHFNQKSGAGLVRHESESEIDAVTFGKLWEKTVGRRLSKVRTRVKVGERTWEIDSFSTFSLVLAEVELGRTDETTSIPLWLAPLILREVTEDSRYRNFNLATSGPPQESVGG